MNPNIIIARARNGELDQVDPRDLTPENLDPSIHRTKSGWTAILYAACNGQLKCLPAEMHTVEYLLLKTPAIRTAAFSGTLSALPNSELLTAGLLANYHEAATQIQTAIKSLSEEREVPGISHEEIRTRHQAAYLWINTLAQKALKARTPTPSRT